MAAKSSTAGPSPAPVDPPCALAAAAARPGRLRFKLLLAAASLLLALGAAETVARFVHRPAGTMRFEQDVSELERMGLHQLAGILENDPELFWRLAPGATLPDDAYPFRGRIANAQHLREDHEIALPKPPGQLRILFLGDSCTFGFGLQRSETFAEVIEQALRDHFPGAAVECVNAGVPGYSLYQGLRFLETRGAELGADLVVLNFGWNDGSEWDGMSDLEHAALLRAVRPPRWLAWSSVARMAWGALGASRPPAPAGDGKKRPRLTTEEFDDVLHRTLALARTQGAEVLVVVWPFIENIDPQYTADSRGPYQRVLLRSAQWAPRLGGTGGGPVVDLVPVAQEMAKRHRPDEIFFDNGHATARATRSFAAAIFARIRPWAAERLQG